MIFDPLDRSENHIGICMLNASLVEISHIIISIYHNFNSFHCASSSIKDILNGLRSVFFHFISFLFFKVKISFQRTVWLDCYAQTNEHTARTPKWLCCVIRDFCLYFRDAAFLSIVESRISCVCAEENKRMRASEEEKKLLFKREKTLI